MSVAIGAKKKNGGTSTSAPKTEKPESTKKKAKK